MKFSFIIILILASFFNTAAQGNDTSSVLNIPVASDTAISSDTTKPVPDSLQGKRFDVDTTIFASSNDSIIFFIDKKEMQVYGNGELEYRSTKLKSDNILVDFETSDITATGTPSDTARKGISGAPVLSEEGETYEGSSMKYNFKTGRGLISSAGTETEGAYYTGEKINKVDEETFFIEDGIFTTCEDSVPHYYFYSPEMKVIHQEQLVAKWIWFFFGGVPFPVPLPFAVFPIESGRRSGLIIPAFGQDARYGYYFSNFGYFWAISDYMDWNITGDYFTRGSYNLNSRFRYSKRYSYIGNLEGGYSLFKQGEQGDLNSSKSIDWRIKWFHSQTIDPTLKLDAKLEFASGSDFYNQNVANISEVLKNDIYSTATLNKSWELGTLSLSYSRKQNLESNSVSEILPGASFNITQKYPFRTKNTSTTNLKWYELIGLSYRGNLENHRNKDSTGLHVRGGAQHNITINASPKVSYFSITPNINYHEKWYNKKIALSYEKDTSGFYQEVIRDVHQINLVRDFSLGVSAQTRFYGIVNPGIFGISSIRHTVTPSLSYTYTPDFSYPGWGYYETYIDSNGVIQRYDPFQKEIFGGLPGRSQAISFNIGNVFEMKTAVDPTDTTSKENKVQLLNLNAGISYNFNAPQYKFSPLNIDARTQVGDWFSFVSGAAFSFYDYNEKGSQIPVLLWDRDKFPLRLTNFNFSVSTSLSGEKIAGAESPQQQKTEEDQYQLEQSDNQIYKGLYEEREVDFSIPWNLALNYNFSLNKSNPLESLIFSNVNATFDFNLTPAWKFSFTGSYDLQKTEFSAPQIRVSRDLHCWVMNFTWNPIGTYRGYTFEIRVKAPQLQDLKVTKRSDFYTGK